MTQKNYTLLITSCQLSLLTVPHFLSHPLLLSIHFTQDGIEELLPEFNTLGEGGAKICLGALIKAFGNADNVLVFGVQGNLFQKIENTI